MRGDPVGLLEPAPVTDPGQDEDLCAREGLNLAVRLVDGDIDVGIAEYHECVMVVSAQPRGQCLDIGRSCGPV